MDEDTKEALIAIAEFMKIINDRVHNLEQKMEKPSEEFQR